MKKILLLMLLLLMMLGKITISAPSEGILKGTVFSNDYKEKLMGANVVILNTALGAVTDINGEFEIKNIPAGSYNVQISFIGYETIIKTDILIKPDKITGLDAGLKESTIQTKDITVNAGYFRDDELTPLGFVNLNTEEIKRAPGSAGDVSRILLNMPSTAKVADNRNDLAVRGGSPAENGFFVDGIPVPNINHFPSIGSTGGPIGLLNIDFIDNVNFYTSGFSAQYSDKLSSVVDIRFREGNRDKLSTMTSLNFAGFGGRIEGPLFTDKGSFMLSGSKSYLDLLVGAIGTGVAPRYGDLQGKIVYDFSKSHKISVIDIYGQSGIDLTKTDAVKQGHNPYFGKSNNYQNSAGVIWQAFWGPKFYSNTVLSHSMISYNNNFSKVTTDEKALFQKIKEQYINLRNTNYLPADGFGKMEFGVDVNMNIGKYDYTRYPDTNSYGGVNPEFSVNKTIKPVRGGVFFTFISNPWNNFQLTTGARADYYSLNKAVNYSPRVVLSYSLTDITKISINGGILYQQIPMYITSQKDEFQKLRNMRSVSYGAGIEHMLSKDTKLTVEVYNKDYDYLPLDPQDPYYSVVDQIMFNSHSNNNLVSTGKANTKGIEIMIQKKLAEDIYGLVSGSYSRARYTDYFNTWRDRLYDNKFLFNIIGGYKAGNNWEFSIRWTYAGGIPYTPFDMAKSKAFDTGILDETRINGERMPDYHTLNFRVDKKFYFAAANLDVYLNILNAYNRKNVTLPSWDKIKNEEYYSSQWSILPVFGVEYEF